MIKLFEPFPDALSNGFFDCWQRNKITVTQVELATRFQLYQIDLQQLISQESISELPLPGDVNWKVNYRCFTIVLHPWLKSLQKCTNQKKHSDPDYTNPLTLQV